MRYGLVLVVAMAVGGLDNLAGHFQPCDSMIVKL